MIFFFIILSVINLLVFLNLQKLSKFINIYDTPDKKLKLHKKKMPILGGIILFINFIPIIFYQIFFLGDILSININQLNFIEITSTLILILGYFFLGLFDDKFNLSPNKKLLFSLIISLIAILLNEQLSIKMMSLSFFENKIFFKNTSYIFSIFCILVLVNALNFYDGINGQSCIIFIVFFSYLFFKSDLNYFYLLIVYSILFVFLLNIYNKTFLGDSGIYFLSVILSICLIYEHNIQQNIIYADEIFLLLLLPGVDLVRLTIFRILNNQNAFNGDRNHIHHLVIKKLSLKNTNIILFLLSVIPITLFSYIQLHFLQVFIVFLILYSLIIFFSKKNF